MSFFFFLVYSATLPLHRWFVDKRRAVALHRVVGNISPLLIELDDSHILAPAIGKHKVVTSY